MKELDIVVLTEDIPEYGLKANDVGTIVMVHNGGEGYEVEFMTLQGDTVAVLTLMPLQIRPSKHHEMSHTRMMVGNL
ncbi:MAG: DUF4926 domain-containing protein [Candidatus Electryoneaceae bacterium]|nr:DUF4926 domain-containing protein [Candidatus Electryoneaceae bacterium]